MIRPRYPIYVISKGRSDCCMTAQFLLEEGTPFHLVIEPQELEQYRKTFDLSLILVLPFSNLGLGSIPARNWVWEHAKNEGHERHWILDDNIRMIERVYRGQRIRCESSIAFAVAEDFIDRYENVAIGGLNYHMFLKPGGSRNPFVRNAHIYSTLLIRNDLPYRWRGRYNEDTDLCLQVISGGWCTVQLNAFLIDKMPTMTMKGGNATELYKGDGRCTMARSLERVWPGVVETKRRFGRPQHVVKGAWKYFDTPLKLRPDADLTPRDYGLNLVAIKPVKSPELRELFAEGDRVNDGTTGQND